MSSQFLDTTLALEGPVFGPVPSNVTLKLTEGSCLYASSTIHDLGQTEYSPVGSMRSSGNCLQWMQDGVEAHAPSLPVRVSRTPKLFVRVFAARCHYKS